MDECNVLLSVRTNVQIYPFLAQKSENTTVIRLFCSAYILPIKCYVFVHMDKEYYSIFC
jgi:hypothetical protein